MNVIFSDHAWDDYLVWRASGGTAIQRIDALIREVQETPFDGAGKPQQLKNALAGYWSRRIDAEHRLVYTQRGDVVFVAALRYSY